MSTQIPYDRPMSQPALVEISTLPVRFTDIHVPAWLGDVVPAVTAACINEVATKVNTNPNPARFHQFNLMSMYSWNNPNFKELVQLAVHMLAVKLIKGQFESQAKVFDEAVSQSVGMLASNDILTHQHLRSIMGDHAVNVAGSNARVYQTCKGEIAQMIQTGQINNPPQQGNQQMYPQPYPPQQQQPSPWPQQQAPQNPWGAPPPVAPPPYGYPQQQPAPPGWQPPQQQPAWPQPPQAANPWGAPPPVSQPYPPQWPQAQAPQGQWPTPPQQYPQQGYPQQPPPGYWTAAQPQGSNWAQTVGVPPGYTPTSPAWGQAPQSGLADAINLSRMADEAKMQAEEKRFQRHWQSRSQAAPAPAPAPVQAPAPQMFPSTFVGQQPQPASSASVPVSPLWSQGSSTVVEEVTQDFVDFEDSKTEYVEIEGGTEMERATHSIAYDGETFQAPTRYDQYRRDAVTLETTTVQVATEPEDKDEDMYVSNAVQYDVSESALMVSAKQKFLERRDVGGDKTTTITRVFGRCGNPFLGREHLKDLVKDLASSNSLAAMAQTMRTRMAMFLGRKKDAQDHKATDGVAFISYIDRIITGRCNNFLQKSMGLKANMESFALDYAEVGPTLEKMFGVRHRNLWDQFCAALSLRLSDMTDDKLEEVAAANFEVKDGYVLVSVPSNLSFTFVDMTLTELGYKVTGDQKLIDKTTCPALYAIAISLRKHKKQMELDTDADYLVTSDNGMYRIERDYTTTGENNFNIRAVEAHIS